MNVPALIGAKAMGHENRGRPLLHPGSLGFDMGPGANCGRHVHVQARARCFVPLVPIKTGPELKNRFFAIPAAAQ
jgi:hypothetical protein